MSIEHLDVLVVGAGISGIAAAYHLQLRCPDARFAILESRENLGGTWSQFTYPGARSDSDIFTLGFSFQPWAGAESIAKGPAIQRYLDETARRHGIDKLIRFRHRLTQASWDSGTARWTVQVERGIGDAPLMLTCNFLFLCTGYYDYAEPYRPSFEGERDFAGPIVHPQFWPAGLDYRGQRIIIIGSGATAVTLVPALVRGGASHVILLQRSPGYLISRPSRDWMAACLHALLPRRLAYRVTRLKFIFRDMLFFQLARRLPALTRRLLIGLVRWKLGPTSHVETDFTPRYDPWQQRLCLVTDDDLFNCLREGSASVETGEIDRFIPGGIRLHSGKELPAELVVTATGLKMELMSGVTLTVDGKLVTIATTLLYKGCMYSDVPNLFSSIGYSNASWTLKAELICEYVCRLRMHMDRHGHDVCVPRANGVKASDAGLLNLESGYVLRAQARMPSQGESAPWKSRHNYFLDVLQLRYGALADGVMEFGAAGCKNRRESQVPIVSQ